MRLLSSLNLARRAAATGAVPAAGNLCRQKSAIVQLQQQQQLFKPVYSVQQKTSYRFANTSSGIYAPSTIYADRPLLSREPQNNLTVFENFDHLPNLPVPNLQSTLEKLKETISPVAMNSAEFVNALQLIDEFGQTAGVKLNSLLREKASQTKNWMTHDWWVREVYLKSRQPLVINSNPSIIYPVLPFDVNNQRSLINMIAQLTSGVIEFKLALIHGYNPEAINAGNENRLDPNLCYSQYKLMFGTTRMPGEHVDTIETSSTSYSSSLDEPFTFIISYRGKFFEVQLQDLENEQGRIDQIAGVLDKILITTEPVSPVGSTDLNGAGVLTSTNRSDWAKTIKLLDQESVSVMQEAQFVVCLDTVSSENQGENPPNPLLTTPVGSESHLAALSRQVLHADNANVGNRWFDKSIQLVVVADDKAERLLGAGINYEHSIGEGTVIAKLVEYSYDKAVQKNRQLSSGGVGSNFFAKQQVQTNRLATFRQLRMFDEGNEELISNYLKEARQNFNSHVKQFDLSYLDYKQYGRNAIKSWHFSPDSWFQVALQSAYWNIHKRLGPCYESASTRRFAYGRTETIRSLTKEVAQFCFEPSFDTMVMAIKSHKSYSISASNGDAIDRALMGYKMVFNELKTKSWNWGLPQNVGAKVDEIPELEQIFTENELSTISAFFNNELINRSTRFALSTSQVSSIHPNICMNYGPILADGYGCCYNISGQQIVAAITANSENQSYSCQVHELNQGLRDSLNHMRDIVEEEQQRVKSGNK